MPENESDQEQQEPEPEKENSSQSNSGTCIAVGVSPVMRTTNKRTETGFKARQWFRGVTACLRLRALNLAGIR